MNRWYLQPILDSYGMVAVLTLALALTLLLSPAFGRLTPGRRAVLLALRAMAMLLVVLAMLRPTYVSTESNPQPSTLALMLDGSRSMDIADTAQGKTRWQAQREAVAGALPLLQDLGDDVEVQYYLFDSEARPVQPKEGEIGLQLKPEGDQSDLGTSLDDVLRATTGKRLAGVILLSDGAQRAVAPRVDIQQPARELARLGYPLYCVPFGLSRDQAQARDVAIENLPDQFTVFAKNELQIDALMRAQGYVNQELPVELIVETPDGKEERFGPLPLRPNADSQQLDVQFVYTPRDAGQYKLTVQAAEAPGELVTENNQLSAFLSVLEGGVRVLYLYGNIVSGQRFECLSIDSSPDIQLDHKWVDSRRREQWPINLRQSLAEDLYDVFMVGDLDSEALGQANCSALAEAIGQGKGFMMLGGYHSFGPGGYRDTKLADVLPVRMGPFERQGFGEPRRTDVHIQRELVILPSFAHFITQLESGARNEPAWRRLPTIFGANKFASVKETNTRVLAQAETGEPILVGGQFGRGRVLALAVDSLAPWYRYGHQAEHKRFWRQAILWLAQKEDSLGDGVWLRLEQRRYVEGAPVMFVAGATGPDGNAMDGVTLQARVVDPQGEEKPARLSPDKDQWSGSFEDTTTPGDYVLEVAARRGLEVVGSVRRRFMVLDQDLEMTDPAANPQQLEQLAGMTSEVGGKTLAPEQLPALLRQIKERPPKMEIEVQTKWQLADTERDAWLFFLCLVGLLCGEWFLRKKWRLV
jgi:uncharacterized membrane protein